MKVTIRIPKGGIDGNELSTLCEHYDCELLRGNRYDAYYNISAEDPTNFFWLGANMTTI